MGVHSDPSVYDQCKDLLGIPRHEPIFILRAQDRLSPQMLVLYMSATQGYHTPNQARVRDLLDEFRKFQKTYPGSVKDPD